MFERKMKKEGTDFLGVDGFFGPGTKAEDFVKWLNEKLGNQ
jgi:methylmalonyl-CoA mutase cobalamin-binding subunit